MKTLLCICCFVTLIGSAYSQDLTTLMPTPKAVYQYQDIEYFYLQTEQVVAVPDTVTPGVRKAVNYFQREMRRRVQKVFTEVTLSYYVLSMQPKKYALVFVPMSNQFAHTFTSRLLNRIESVSAKTGSYILDVRQSEMVIFYDSDEGAFNAVSTLLQLLSRDKFFNPQFFACHIWDEPDYPLRWMFSQHNLLVDQSITNLTALADTMAKYKLNGIQQNDYKYNILDRMFDRYWNNVDTFKARCADRMIDVIPGVCGIGWSDGILQHDPNLAEGVFAQTTYVIESDTGRVIPDARVVLPNGDFETVNLQGAFTGWGFYDECFTPDKTVFRSGKTSAHAINIRDKNSAGNARFQRKVQCTPYGYYVMSAYIKTNNLNGGSFNLLAIGDDGKGKSRSLTFTALSLPATTNGWQRVEVCFNTLEFVNVSLYCGVWDAPNTGEFWIDDFTIQPAGLTNILRRGGTPLHIRNKNTGVEYSEFDDFARLHDTLMEKSFGTYGPYHTAPTLRRLANGALRNGDSVVVSYFHPFTAVSDNQGNGSVMVCVSEDTLHSILTDQVTRVNNLYHAKNYFMGHDEIRNMNRDSACLQHKQSPAELLAANLRSCDSIINRIAPTSQRFVWSDMFDSLHNAGPIYQPYYLVNGNLSGDWNMIPKNITIVNWNGGEMSKSLSFFADKGFRQVTSPYYDAGNPTGIRNWRLAQEGIYNIDGMMYTTWAADYSQLRPFAYYAWSAGPYIFHRPPDSLEQQATEINLTTSVGKDPYNAKDNYYDPTIVIFKTNLSQVERRIYMTQGIPNGPWNGTVPTPQDLEWFRYAIEVKSTNGIYRITPMYEVWRNGTTSVISESEPITFTVTPNPTEADATVNFSIPQSGQWTLHITDVLGKTIATYSGTTYALQQQTVHLSTAQLATGVYAVTLTNNGNTTTTVLVKE
ncbi:MAG: T9SS type A sorting domain-containing protein [Candidatus Kapabacteria bacterium]|nr:T9SS type A sorting domain-containing protein [Candidatus Kapabacteria bacterium]